MRLLAVGFVISNLLVSNCFAQAPDQDSVTVAEPTRENGWNQERSTKVAAGVSAAVASGIYSAKKFSSPGKIKASGMETLYNDVAEASVVESKVQKAIESLRNGDQVTIYYKLTPAENREYYIKLMERKASRQRALAHAFQDEEATGSLPNGNIDWSGRAIAGGNADDASVRANKYDLMAKEARAGGPVPVNILEKVIDGNKGTAANSSAFISQEYERGSKILAIERLPIEKVNLAKMAVRKGAAGVVGAVVSVGYAAKVALEAEEVRELNSPRHWRPKQATFEKNQEAVR